jgi:hypothetical protein
VRLVLVFWGCEVLRGGFFKMFFFISEFKKMFVSCFKILHNDNAAVCRRMEVVKSTIFLILDNGRFRFATCVNRKK